MRRVVPSFTVEVRRRPRLATTANPNAPSSATKPAPAAFDRASQRAAVAAFGAQGANLFPVVDVAASHPMGRILPSLVPDQPQHRLLEDVPISAADSEPPSQGPKRPSARAPKRGEQAAQPPRNSSFPSDESAAVAEGLSTASRRISRVQSDEGAGATSQDPPRAPSQVVGDSRSLELTAKGRQRTIMARYVFGDADKPGARWKRRLLGSR